MKRYKIEMRIKEAVWQKFINDKKLLLGLLLRQVELTMKQQM